MFLAPEPWLLIPDKGGVAQLGERLLCKQEVTGSIPVGSTSGTRRHKARQSQDPREEPVNSVAWSVGGGV